ncbi:MAG TPA: carbohydrate ABC transporter permease [Candidatus Hydrogenedentes bacterium]|nr:carbohydrate ABC transporter permease [Candidatus Hydrogenedentota bacterium]
MRTKRSAIWGAYGGVIVACAIMGLPFFWMLITSFKTPAEAAVYPPRWWPEGFRWENYVEAWRAAPFGVFYRNSILVAFTATALQLVCATFMAYALAVIRFPGKRVILILVISTMIVPEEMKLVPNFLLLRELGWIDTHAGLIVPAIAHAFPVFVLHQQFRQVPSALLDAARIDGAGHVRTLWHVSVPLSRPMIAAAAVLGLLGQWNSYLWPLIVTNSTAMRTLPIGLAYLRKQAEEGTAPWNLLMAAAVFAIAPVVILYLFAQKQFVEGITRGALKG